MIKYVGISLVPDKNMAFIQAIVPFPVKAINDKKAFGLKCVNAITFDMNLAKMLSDNLKSGITEYNDANIIAGYNKKGEYIYNVSRS